MASISVSIDLKKLGKLVDTMKNHRAKVNLDSNTAIFNYVVDYYLKEKK